MFSFRYDGFCYAQPRYLATYCLHAFRHLVNKSEDYQSLYLDFIYFEMAQANPSLLSTDKCQITNLKIPTGDEPLNIQVKHVICRRGPVIFSTDMLNENQYYEDISIHISLRMNLMIFKRIDRENHQILANFQSNLSRVKLLKQEIQTPLSTSLIGTTEQHVLKSFT